MISEEDWTFGKPIETIFNQYVKNGRGKFDLPTPVFVP